MYFRLSPEIRQKYVTRHRSQATYASFVTVHAIFYLLSGAKFVGYCLARQMCKSNIFQVLKADSLISSVLLAIFGEYS